MKYFLKQISASQIIKGVIVCSVLVFGTSQLVNAIGTNDDPLQAPQLPQGEPSHQAAPPPPPPPPVTVNIPR